jgi:hypothetical protein
MIMSVDGLVEVSKSLAGLLLRDESPYTRLEPRKLYGRLAKKAKQAIVSSMKNSS